MTSVRRIVQISLYLILIAMLLGSSTVPPGDRVEGVRAFTREIEFDYIAWILNALGTKLSQAALGTSDYLTAGEQRQEVRNYLDLVDQIQRRESELNTMYADPSIADPAKESAKLRAELQALYTRRTHLGPVAEAVIQDQLAQTVSGLGLTVAGQPLPPILYHSTPLPLALIVSPRDAIRQDADISLVPDLTVDQRDALENEVDRAMDVSSLVVPIGGIGVYPTMVMQTGDLNWLRKWWPTSDPYLTLTPLDEPYEHP
jgi:hypothetical protein